MVAGSNKLSYKIRGWIGWLTVALPVLSSMRDLRTWNEFIQFLGQQSEEFLMTIDFIGRLLQYVLLPYHWITSIFFNLIPIDIPEQWQDPVIIGLMVCLIPLIELKYFLHNPISILTIFIWKRLYKITSKRSKKPEKTILKINRYIKSFRGKHVTKILKRESEKYIQALQTNKDAGIIEVERVRFHNYLKNHVLPIVESIQTRLSDKKRSVRLYRIKGLLAFVILVLIALDSVYAGSSTEFIFITLRSCLFILLLAVVPFVFILFLSVILSAISHLLGSLEKREFINERNKKRINRVKIYVGSSVLLIPYRFFFGKGGKSDLNYVQTLFDSMLE